MREERKPRIYCFVNSGEGTDFQIVLGLAEDGTLLASHCSSNKYFAQMDIGFTEPVRGPGVGKRELYEAHYPDGYELEWVDDPRHHEGIDAAYELNQQQRREHEAVSPPDTRT